jgi:hypothetical protein
MKIQLGALLTFLIIALVSTPVMVRADDLVVSTELSGDNYVGGVVQDDAQGWNEWVESVTGGDSSVSERTLGQGTDDSLGVDSGGFIAIQGDGPKTSAEEDDGNLEPKITDVPLCYPNPFRQTEATRLQYTLNKSMPLEIHMYDMLANCILKQSLSSGSQGAKKGHNSLEFKDIDGYKLSVGVYFVFIVNNGKVLGKTKMAVLP